jgi:hypothetical protein
MARRTIETARIRPSRLLAAITFALALVALAPLTACGDEDEPAKVPAEAPPKAPALTVPHADPEPAPTQRTETTPAPATLGEDSATAPLAPGEGDGTVRPPRTTPDSPDNDTPPPAGSPAERFERECEESPAACG